MNGAFYIGAIGLDAQQRALDVIANNIANINTNGFKRSVVQFSTLVAPTNDISTNNPASFDSIAGLAGVAVSATPHVWTKGDLQQTGQPLDVAIDGQGFIELLGPSGQNYLWRGGSMKINADGYLSTADGTILRAMISVPQGTTAINIASDGTINAAVSGQNSAQQLGRLDLVMVKDPDSLADAGNGFYEATDPSALFTVQPGEEGSGLLVQGALETANVKLADEMTNLLLTQRAFAANAQVVQAGDQLMSIVNGLRS
jgi:flagellar basal-body rod protein FlgG